MPPPPGIEVREERGALVIRTYRSGNRRAAVVRLAIAALVGLVLIFWISGSPARNDNGSPSGGIGVLLDLGVVVVLAIPLAIWGFVELIHVVSPRRTRTNGVLRIEASELQLDDQVWPLPSVEAVSVEPDAFGHVVAIAPHGVFGKGAAMSAEAAGWVAGQIEQRRAPRSSSPTR